MNRLLRNVPALCLSLTVGLFAGCQCARPTAWQAHRYPTGTPAFDAGGAEIYSGAPYHQSPSVIYEGPAMGSSGGGGTIELPSPVGPHTGTPSLPRDVVPRDVAPREGDPNTGGPSENAKPRLTLKASSKPTVVQGENFKLRVDVMNMGGKATAVAVRGDLPQGVTVVSSRPQATVKDGKIEWYRDELPANRGIGFEADLRADEPGPGEACFTVDCQEGSTDKGCANWTAQGGELELKVDAPKTARVGDKVTFQITVFNRGAAAIRGVSVENEHDPEFSHKVEGLIESAKFDLPANGEKQLVIKYDAVGAGKACNQVRAIVAGEAVATNSACVQISEAPARPRASISASGPESLTVGETGSWTIEVINEAAAAVANLEVNVVVPAALEVVDATPGRKVDERGRSVWTLRTLPGNKSTRYTLDCRALEKAEQQTLRATLSSDGEAIQTGTAPFRVTAASKASLEMQVLGLGNPVLSGKTAVHTVKITNRGAQPVRDLVVSCELPPGITLVPEGTKGPAGMNLPLTEQGQRLSFGALGEIAPGETLVWTFKSRGTEPGNYEYLFTARAKGLTKEIESVKELTIEPLDDK